MRSAGALAALYRRAFWPLLLLALPGVFFVWSMRFSGGTPDLHSGAAAVLLLQQPLRNGRTAAVRAGRAPGWSASRPVRCAPRVAALAIVAAVIPWVAHPSPSNWVTWEESRVNSEARREWTRQAADYLRPRYVRGSGIFTGFGDLTGSLSRAGHPAARDVHAR